MADKRATAKTATAKKAAPNRAAAKAAAKKAAPKKAAAKKTAPKKTAPKKAAAKSTATKARAAKSTPAKRAAGAEASFAAGASRAAAEPRTASPLLRATAESTLDAVVTPSYRGADRGADRTPATPEVPEVPEVPGETGTETPERRLRVVPDLGADPGDGWADPGPPTGSTHTRSRAAGLLDLLGVITGEDERIEDAVGALVNLLRVAATAAGLDTEDTEEQVARTLAYLRRRAAGDFTVDEFGFDPDFTENVWLPLLRPVYQKWFRVEVRGVENIPTTGGALVVANHSGPVPVDGLMTQVAIHDEAGRNLRMLGADLVFELPFVGSNARRTGSTLAAAADAERLLRGGELVGVYPEGFKGVGKPFSERYKLQRFGRGGFVAAALRTGTPIIPCSIIGAEEIYPLIGNISVLARLMGAPYFPVTPFFPLLGPLGLIPLPSKWIIAFGEPVDTASIGPAGAEDPMLVFDLTDQVRETIQPTLYSLLMQRRSVFF